MSDFFSSKPKVGVILLNWNNWLETKACLENLAQIDTSTIDLVTIVVDNGSQDNSITQLEKLDISFLIPLDSNLGYAGGCNRGIVASCEIGCDFILLLNSDVEFSLDFINFLMNVFLKHPDVGIASPKILNDEKPARVYFAGGKIFPFRMKDRLIGIGKLDSHEYDQEGYSDFGIGCCLLIKNEVFNEVGYLDDRFFFDYEDVDFCYRAKLKGIRTWYEPKSIIIHKAPLIPRNRHRAFLLGKGRITFFHKYIHGKKFWLAFSLEYIYTARVMFNYLIRKRHDLARGYLDGVIVGSRIYLSQQRKVS